MVVWGPMFVRCFKKTVKKHPEFRGVVEGTLKQLALDPFAPRPATHKLKGKLAGTWTCSAGYDLRIVFDFVESATGQEDEADR